MASACCVCIWISEKLRLVGEDAERRERERSAILIVPADGSGPVLRQVLAGIKAKYSPEQLVGRHTLYVRVTPSLERQSVQHRDIHSSRCSMLLLAITSGFLPHLHKIR